jgi:hypothetical protein
VSLLNRPRLEHSFCTVVVRLEERETEGSPHTYTTELLTLGETWNGFRASNTGVIR